MSTFLGKIHYWLYNKILLHESLIESVGELAKEKGYNFEGLLIESYARFGEPVTGALEENIEHSNIHGWLQERIHSVEKRLAYIITVLLRNDILKNEEIAQIFHQNGAEAAKALSIAEGKPQDIYTHIFDYMLEGMPCDRVNEILEDSADAIVWKTTRCLHKDHWDQVGGDVENFYYYKDHWMDGFLKASGTGYRYKRAEDGINRIRRV